MSARMRRVPALLVRLTGSWSAIPEWFLRLYRRPRIFLAVLLGIPLVVTCAWVYVVSEHQWRAREARDLIVASQMAAQLIHDDLRRAQATGNALSRWPPFQDAVQARDRYRLADQLQLLLDVSPRLEQVLVTDPANKPIAQRTAAGPGVLVDPAPAEPSQPISGVYLRDRRTGEKAIEVSSVVRSGETTLGRLRSHYQLAELSRWLGRIRIEPAGFLYVVDQDGYLVAHPYQVLPGQPKDVSVWPPVAAEASAAGTLVRFTQGRPARAWTAAVVSLEPFGWRVVAQQPDAVMLAPFHRLVGAFLLVVIALVGLVSLVAFRWARLHQTALELLAQQARLLRSSEQQRLKDRLRRSERPDHA